MKSPTVNSSNFQIYANLCFISIRRDLNEISLLSLTKGTLKSHSRNLTVINPIREMLNPSPSLWPRKPKNVSVKINIPHGTTKTNSRQARKHSKSSFKNVVHFGVEDQSQWQPHSIHDHMDWLHVTCQINL